MGWLVLAGPACRAGLGVQPVHGAKVPPGRRDLLAVRGMRFAWLSHATAASTISYVTVSGKACRRLCKVGRRAEAVARPPLFWTNPEFFAKEYDSCLPRRFPKAIIRLRRCWF